MGVTGKAVGTVAGAGIGTAVGGPVGGVIGAGLGGVVGGLFDSDPKAPPPVLANGANYRYGENMSGQAQTNIAGYNAQANELQAQATQSQQRTIGDNGAQGFAANAASGANAAVSSSAADGARQQQLASLGRQQQGNDALTAYAQQAEGPSAAQAQLQAGANQSFAQQLAGARSGTNAGGGAAAMRNAQFQQAGIMGNENLQAAQVRAQETQNYHQQQLQALSAAQQGYAAESGAASNLRTGDQSLGQLQANTALQAGQLQAGTAQNFGNQQLQNRGINNQYSLGLGQLAAGQNQLAQNVYSQQLSANMQLDANNMSAQNGTNMMNAQLAQQNNAATMGMIGGAAQGIAMASDIRSKQSIQPMQDQSAMQQQNPAAQAQAMAQRAQMAQAFGAARGAAPGAMQQQSFAQAPGAMRQAPMGAAANAVPGYGRAPMQDTQAPPQQQSFAQQQMAARPGFAAGPGLDSTTGAAPNLASGYGRAPMAQPQQIAGQQAKFTQNGVMSDARAKQEARAEGAADAFAAMGGERPQYMPDGALLPRVGHGDDPWGQYGRDARAKRSVDHDTSEFDDGPNFRGAPGYSYEYRDPNMPGAAPGTHYGPMAQDLERTPEGASVVDQGPDGMKRVDTGRLGLLNTAAISGIQRRQDAQDAQHAAMHRAFGTMFARPATDSQTWRARAFGLRHPESYPAESPTQPEPPNSWLDDYMARGQR